MKLYKTTIVIWSDTNPSEKDLDDLARDAICGDSYCSKQQTVFVQKAEVDPDWDGNEFFGVDDDEDESEE